MKQNCAKRNFLSVISDPNQHFFMLITTYFSGTAGQCQMQKPHLFHIQGQPLSQGFYVLKNLQNTVSRNTVYMYVYLKDFTF